jgi:hypothetical protein
VAGRILSPLALNGGQWSGSRSGCFTTGTHCTGGWVGPRGGLDTETVSAAKKFQTKVVDDNEIVFCDRSQLRKRQTR